MRMPEYIVQAWFDNHSKDKYYPTLTLAHFLPGLSWPSACVHPDPLWSASRESRNVIAERCNLESPNGGVLRGLETYCTTDEV